VSITRDVEAAGAVCTDVVDRTEILTFVFRQRVLNTDRNVEWGRGDVGWSRRSTLHSVARIHYQPQAKFAGVMGGR